MPAGWKKCSICLQDVRKDGYSNKQYKHANGKRKCIACIHGPASLEEAAGAPAPSTTDVSATGGSTGEGAPYSIEWTGPLEEVRLPDTLLTRESSTAVALDLSVAMHNVLKGRLGEVSAARSLHPMVVYCRRLHDDGSIRPSHLLLLPEEGRTKDTTVGDGEGFKSLLENASFDVLKQMLVKSENYDQGLSIESDIVGGLNVEFRIKTSFDPATMNSSDPTSALAGLSAMLSAKASVSPPTASTSPEEEPPAATSSPLQAGVAVEASEDPHLTAPIQPPPPRPIRVTTQSIDFYPRSASGRLDLKDMARYLGTLTAVVEQSALRTHEEHTLRIGLQLQPVGDERPIAIVVLRSTPAGLLSEEEQQALTGRLEAVNRPKIQVDPEAAVVLTIDLSIAPV